MRCVISLTILAPMLLAPLAPVTAAAQQGGGTIAAPPHRTPRSKIFAIAGAVIGAAAGFGYAKASESGVHGGCLGIQCVIVGTTVGGALFGYFIGREYDLTYASRYHGVAPLNPPNTSVDLAGDPVALAINDSLIAIGGSAGVQLVSLGTGFHAQALRAGGLRGIGVVTVAPETGWLALGSPSGLYLFPPPPLGHQPGSLVREGDIGTATATADRVFFGVDDRIEAAPLPAAAETTRAWPGVNVDATPRDLALDGSRSLLWAVTDRALVSYKIAGDSLVRVGSTPLEGAGRRLALTHDTVIVAMGERGVRLFDAANPAAPREIARWTIANFAYDVSVDSNRLFVAAGPEGVYVLELAHGTIRTLGLARSLGFASALASRDGYTYILDRRSNALRRITSDF
jgi:hypothetical protein